MKHLKAFAPSAKADGKERNSIDKLYFVGV